MNWPGAARISINFWSIPVLPSRLGPSRASELINRASSFSRPVEQSYIFQCPCSRLPIYQPSRDFLSAISFKCCSIGRSLVSRADSRSLSLSIASISIGLSLFGSFMISLTLLQTACSRPSALMFLFLHFGEPSRWVCFNCPLHM